jgi:hypothetical protein
LIQFRHGTVTLENVEKRRSDQTISSMPTRGYDDDLPADIRATPLRSSDGWEV